MKSSTAAFVLLAASVASVAAAGLKVTPLPRAATTSSSSIPSPTPAGTTSQCSQYYLVKPSETCNDVTYKTGVTLSEFLTLNPEVNSDCTNLLAGYYYCVAPSSSSTTSTSTTSTSTSSTSAITPVPTAPPNTAAGTPKGDPNQCDLYGTVQPGDACGVFAQRNQLSQGLMISLNPELNADCSNLLANEAYCVGVPYIGPCMKFYTPVSGDTCSAIYANYTISASDFQTLNPDVGNSCAIRVGQAYCVKATISPKPTSTSKSSTKKTSTSSTKKTSSTKTSSTKKATSTPSCSQTTTVKKGQSCSDIEKKYNLTSKQFLALNPKINSKCSNISTGDKVCVKK